jgi:hypothetical protein
MIENEPRKENEITCAKCGHPIDTKSPDVGWINANGFHYHLNHYKEPKNIVIFEKDKNEQS